VTAVLLDALGTLVALDPPAPRLRRLLAEEGYELSEEQAAAGFAAEISYYLEHHLEGYDAASLADLRDRCARVLMESLALPGLDHVRARQAMLAALHFEAFPEVAGVLQTLRERGHPLVVVSNWDCSLPERLEDAALLELVDGVVTSATAGAAKPDPAIFAAGLAIAAARPDQAVHVGDSPEKDVAGARAAGIRALLLCRDGRPPGGVDAIATLAELPALV
jgi:HAD superfamily hydrolase (TIGR01549 family)